MPLLRIRRSINIRLKYFLLKLGHLLGFIRPSNLDILVPLWSKDAALPGNLEFLESVWAKPACGSNLREVEQVQRHEIQLFELLPINVNFSSCVRVQLIKNYFDAEYAENINRYIPIDWHQDFFSGHRWSEDVYYRDIKINIGPSVDIKVPRELSRFHHVAVLARGDRKKTALEFALQVTDWIVANPFQKGVNWECSMDVAIRAVNWIWGLRIFQKELVNYPKFLCLIVNSLRDHGRHIFLNLDYYGEEVPTTNHYLAEIAGLLHIGGAFPELPEADIWLAMGIQEVVTEMQREVLADGVVYESSSSYHRLVAEIFANCASIIERIPISRRRRILNMNYRNPLVNPPLRLSKINEWLDLLSGEVVLPEWFYSRLRLMARFSLAIRKPNGLVFQIGDNDSGRLHKIGNPFENPALNHDQLLSIIGYLTNDEELIKAGYSADEEGRLISGDFRKSLFRKFSEKNKLSICLRNLEFFREAGIVVYRNKDYWLGVSCGNTGKKGTGGHGHNDKNSFSLNVLKSDFFVDGGSPFYTSNPEIRNLFRSTAVHNTVFVDGEEQNNWVSGIPGLFKLKERASPEISITHEGNILGSHFGFGNPHIRVFRMENNKIVIEDKLECKKQKILAFNLHPSVIIENPIIKNSRITVKLMNGENNVFIYLTVIGVSKCIQTFGAYSIGYMRPVDNIRLLFPMNGSVSKSIISW